MVKPNPRVRYDILEDEKGIPFVRVWVTDQKIPAEFTVDFTEDNLMAMMVDLALKQSTTNQ